MKCSCGCKNVVKPKHSETEQQFLQRFRCNNCYKKGQWRVLSDDEARWD